MTYKPYTKVQSQTVGVVGAVTDDTGVAAWVWYDTKNGNGSNTAVPTLTVSATTMVFASTGDTSLPDDGSTTAGTLTYSVATVDTWGEMADVINATDNWKCTLVSALRSTPTTASMIVALTAARIAGSAAAISGCNEYNPVRIWMDLDGVDASLCCIGPEYQQGDNGTLTAAHAGSWRSDKSLRPGGDPTAIWLPIRPIDTVSRVTQIVAQAGNAGTNATPLLKVYSSTQAADTLIYSRTLADDTELALDVNDLVAVQSQPGQRLVISLAQASADSTSLQVNGEYGPVGAW